MAEILMNKKDWGEGEWLNEPGMNEIVEFDYKGYRCILVRNDFGSWCGYVEIPAESKWAKYDNYMDIPLDVHGGVTYGQAAKNKETGKEIYIIGFDCNHGSDYAPRSEAINKNLHLFAPTGIDGSSALEGKVKELQQKMLDLATSMHWKQVYRTLDYATEQLKGLVDQMDSDQIEENNGD